MKSPMPYFHNNSPENKWPMHITYFFRQKPFRTESVYLYRSTRVNRT